MAPVDEMFDHTNTWLPAICSNSNRSMDGKFSIPSVNSVYNISFSSLNLGGLNEITLCFPGVQKVVHGPFGIIAALQSDIAAGFSHFLFSLRFACLNQCFLLPFLDVTVSSSPHVKRNVDHFPHKPSLSTPSSPSAIDF